MSDLVGNPKDLFSRIMAYIMLTIFSIGFDLPKDTMVLFNVWSVHHDPRYWKQPMKFDPTRYASNKDVENIRILHECQVRIDKSVLRVTFWHHEARQVIPNCDPRDRFVCP